MFWLEAAGPPSEGPFPLLLAATVQRNHVFTRPHHHSNLLPLLIIFTKLLLLYLLLPPAAPTAPLPASQLLDAFGAFQL